MISYNSSQNNQLMLLLQLPFVAGIFSIPALKSGLKPLGID
jgi:hypothetical protein